MKDRFLSFCSIILLFTASPVMAQSSNNTVGVSGFDVQGHRGARGLLPENTIPGFIKALELGVTTLEMDVVITKDSQVVLSHEPWFSCVICSLPSGEPVPVNEHHQYKIYEMTYEEVKQFDCGKRGHALFPRQKAQPAFKPLLKDVIEAAEAYVEEHGLAPIYYNIETKSQPQRDNIFHPDPITFTLLLYDVLIKAGVKERTILQSFDVRTLQAGQRLDPDWRLALLVEREGDKGVAANLDELGFTPHIYSPNYHLVDEELLNETRARGMQVIPWTINTLEEMQHLKDLGVDGIITDYPDIGVALLD